MSDRRSALVIKHDPYEYPGYVGDRLIERGYTLSVLPVAPSFRDSNPVVDFGRADEHDLIVSLGSIWSVYDHERIGNWIGDELELLAKAHASDVPVLGVCFGGQALAAALGGEVTPSPEAEIGWRTVRSDRPDGIHEGPWMQWHYDRFSVPPGAVEVARNDVGPQAFVSGHSLGVQFHPEVDAAVVDAWLDAGSDELDKAGIDPAAIRADSRRHAAEARGRTARLVDWFLDGVARLG